MQKLEYMTLKLSAGATATLEVAESPQPAPEL